MTERYPMHLASEEEVIKARRLQRSFGDGLIAAEVKDLHEAWMKHADTVLEDEELVSAVHHALSQRRPNSRRRGREGFPAEVVLRLLILKHVRDFSRVGGGKMPDAKTMGRWGVALGPAVITRIHDRIVQIAHAKDVVRGSRMRVDTTVVETNIHYPTDSSLL